MGRGRPISYEAYVAQYEKEAEKHEMASEMYDRRDFIETYLSNKTTLINEGKKPQNITREIVRQQAYKMSLKTGRLLQKARKNLGMPKMTIRDIRVADKKNWDVIKDAHKEVKEIQKKIEDAKNKGLVSDDEDINEMINVASEGLTDDVKGIVRGFFKKYKEDHDPNDAFGAIESLTSLQINKYIFGSE